MANSLEIDVLHLDDRESRVRPEKTVCEFLLRLIVNDQQITMFRCSPDNLEAMVTGFLASEGIISGKTDIERLEIDIKSGTAFVHTAQRNGRKKHGENPSAAPGMYRKTPEEKMISDVCLTRAQVLSLYRRFQENSILHRETNAAHSAALCDSGEMIVYAEDIGRHNAVDRAIGGSIMAGISPSGKILLTSCRISSDIVTKAATVGIPVLISKSAPTDRGVELAREAGMTLIGFVYRSGMNVYAGEGRIDIQS
jgi:FdhD protein